jgi:hypothetical protein
MCNDIAMLLRTPTSNYCLHETRLIFCLCDVTELAVTLDNDKINTSSKKKNEEIRTVDTQLTHVSDLVSAGLYTVQLGYNVMPGTE